jgi:gliding motility-associated-like protein
LNDTTFLHQPSADNLAGCYYITTVDSVEVNGGGNESPASEVVRTDNCPVYVLPNAFTPNGDGQNDVFRPFLPFRYVSEVEFTVVNRWDQTVFSTKDPNINWDGRDQKTGELLADGVYFYTCVVYENRLDGPQKRRLEGYVHLIRGVR